MLQYSGCTQMRDCFVCQIIKVVNTSDEHVMVYGGNFSLEADSHLVCMQEQQVYKTQAINIQNQPRRGEDATVIIQNTAA